MSANDFWAASPRAILTLYDCARQARGQAAGAAGGGRGARTAKPRRLSRLPHLAIPVKSVGADAFENCLLTFCPTYSKINVEQKVR